MNKIRIKDIARIANVSTGTVDRVIHGRAGVSDHTRKYIKKLLNKYDYQPDILAGALASKRQYRFLVCMPEVVNAHAFWSFPETGIAKALEEIQHFDVIADTLRFDQQDKEDFKRKVALVDPTRYDGLLFAPVFTECSVEFIRKWSEANVPVILFNSRLEETPETGYIGQDANQSGYVGGKLMSFGLSPGRDLLIVNLSLRKDNYQHIIRRENGFRAYFEEHTDRVNNLVTADISGEDYNTVRKELDRKMEELDLAGIFVTNSRVHLVSRYLAEKGIMNIRLIGYDLIKESIDYLKREYIDFLISQSPEEQSYLGIRQLYLKIVLKKKISWETLMPIDILTKENVNYYLKYHGKNE